MFSQFETIALMLLTITQAILMTLALDAYYDIKGLGVLIICLIVAFILSSFELTILSILKEADDDNDE